MVPTQNRTNRLGLYVVLGILLILVAAPLISVLSTAVFGYGSEPSSLGLLKDPGMLRVILNTIWLSILVVLFATVFALPLAFLRSWTKLKDSTWLEVAILIPFMTPPFAAAMAWMDFTRRGGVATMLLGETLGRLAYEAIYSVWGMAFIMAAELYPFLYLVLRNALSSISASAIEMAEVAGASTGHIFTKVIAPIIAGPYSMGALIIFIKAAGEFGTPVTLGNAIGYKVLVSAIYQDVTIDPLSFSDAAARSSVLFTIGVCAWAIQMWISRRDHVSGGRVARQFFRPLRPATSVVSRVFVALVVLLTVAIPYISITLGAMTILRSQPPTLDNLTFDYFGIVLSMPSGQEAILRSLALGFIGATSAAALALVVTVLTLRKNAVVAKVVDFIAIAPDTVPGIVMAIGFILLWNSPRLPITPYGTQVILVMAFSVLFLPTAVQNVKTSALAVSPTMYQAAEIAGASRGHIFRAITLPLLAPGLLAGWFLAFFVGFRELVMSSLIRPSNINLLAPWIMNQFDQGHRAEAMAMTLIGVGTSALVLVAVTMWQQRRKVQL